jgi:hypothetical protein
VEKFSLQARAKGLPGLKQLQIRGLNITKEQLDRLLLALGDVGLQQDSPSQAVPPRYYASGGNSSFQRNDDGAPIDVEECPFCADVRMVYDCTLHKEPSCKGCTSCISRCVECGICIRDRPHEVSVCNSLVCEECWFGLPKCAECNGAVCSLHTHEWIERDSKNFICPDCIFAKEYPETSRAFGAIDD